MHKKLKPRKYLKAKLGISSIPMLEKFLSQDGNNLAQKFKSFSFKNGILGDNQIISAIGQKAINSINPDFYNNNKFASSVQNARGQVLGTVGKAMGGPAGEFAGKLANEVWNSFEAFSSKNDCKLDPITGKPMINPETGECFKKYGAEDALNLSSAVGQIANSFKYIGKGHGFAPVVQSFASALPIGRILGIQDPIARMKAMQMKKSSISSFDAEQQRKAARAQAYAQQQELLKQSTIPSFGVYAKGGKVSSKTQSCGCNKEKDGLDTDIFYGMPRKLFNQVLRRINLPEGTPYSNKVKIILKNSVPPTMTLREYVERISPEIKEYIKQKDKVKK